MFAENSFPFFRFASQVCCWLRYGALASIELSIAVRASTRRFCSVVSSIHINKHFLCLVSIRKRTLEKRSMCDRASACRWERLWYARSSSIVRRFVSIRCSAIFVQKKLLIIDCLIVRIIRQPVLAPSDADVFTKSIPVCVRVCARLMMRLFCVFVLTICAFL